MTLYSFTLRLPGGRYIYIEREDYIMASKFALRQNTNLKPKDIIFGAAFLGGNKFQRPPTSTEPKYTYVKQEDTNATVHEALKLGIEEFDTAPLYGNSEDRLGTALAASSLHGNALITTKAGRLIRLLKGNRDLAIHPPKPFEPFSIPLEERALIADYSRSGAITSYNESIERMCTHPNVSFNIHTLRMHDPDSFEGASEQCCMEDGLIQGLVDLKKSGKIQNVSIGMNSNYSHKVVSNDKGGFEDTHWDPSAILNIFNNVPENTIDNALLAYGWNLFNQDGVGIYEECYKRGIKVHNAGVFSGIYHINAGSVAFSFEEQEKLRKINGWKELASKYNVSLAAIACSFGALPNCVDKLVIGMKNVQEVHDNINAVEESNKVPEEIWKDAVHMNLLEEEILDLFLN